MSIIKRRSRVLRARCHDDLSLQMLQSPGAFDTIAGGRALVPTYNLQSVQGNPNTIGADTMFGSGQAIMGGEGNIFALVSGAGVNPLVTGSAVIMALATLPVNSLDTAGRGISISAFGSMVSGSATRCQIYWNCGSGAAVGQLLTTGTLIADTTSQTGGGAFSLAAFIFKYGQGVLVQGSGLTGVPANTQIGIHQQAQVGSTVFALVTPTLLTATENAVITVAVVGTVTAAGLGVGNLGLNLVQITASN